MRSHEPRVACIGAGPAGLTAAYLLSKHRVPTIVLEKDSEYVGGIARTVNYKGFHIDIGGHRFYSKSQAIENLWTELLPFDMLTLSRSSRIYYRGKFFNYPIRIFEALIKLGPWESILCLFSCLYYYFFPYRKPRTFAQWVSNQFGKRLFNVFFKSYTEKVWGMSCDEISADWAAQRIQQLSLFSALRNSLRNGRWFQGEPVIKTLITSFRYPRKGPGMLWEGTAKKIREHGGTVQLGCQVEGLSYNPLKKLWTVSYRDLKADMRSKIEVEHVISSAPLREICQSIAPPLLCKGISEKIRYRDFIIVALMLRKGKTFPDQWVYIHDPKIKAARIQNFKSWSPEMVPHPSFSCYGLEYFCFKEDGLWDLPDVELLNLATSELEKLRLARRDEIFDGCVIRQQKAYPVYDQQYRNVINIIRKELEDYPNLHLVGRNGMHKYNNQDHSMMTAMLTVENILAKKQLYDVWNVNENAEYLEIKEDDDGTEPNSGIRLTPQKAA